MSTKSVSLLAAGVVGVEGLAVAGLVVWQVSALAGGDTDSLSSAVALIVLTAIGAALMLAFAVAVARGLSWGRSGGIVAQVLIGAVALGAATGAYAHPLIGLALAVPAVLGFVLLVVAARRAAADRTAQDEASAH